MKRRLNEPTLNVDGDRWRAHLRTVRRRQARPGAGGQGQRLRLRPRPARPQGRPGAGRRHARGRHLRGAARGRRPRSPATCWCSPRGARSDPPSTAEHRHAGSCTRVGRLEDLGRLLDRAARRPLRAGAADQHEAPRPGRAASCAPRPSGRSARTRGPAEGVALHLPLAQGSHLNEVEPPAQRRRRRGPATPRPSGSATSPPTSSTRLRAAYPDFTFRPRIGTDLWLGDRGALRVTATVLDVHPCERGDVFGYRGRSAPKAGHLLVVSGGTAHGIGLESPIGESVPQGAGRHRSPAAAWTRSGSCGRRTPSTASSACSPSPRTCRPRCCSCPHGAAVPRSATGRVRVRYTATTFDRVDLG